MIKAWWFGTSILFSHILGIIIPIDVHIFQRGSNHNQKNFRSAALNWNNSDLMFQDLLHILMTRTCKTAPTCGTFDAQVVRSIWMSKCTPSISYHSQIKVPKLPKYNFMGYTGIQTHHFYPFFPCLNMIGMTSTELSCWAWVA